MGNTRTPSPLARAQRTSSKMKFRASVSKIISTMMTLENEGIDFVSNVLVFVFCVHVMVCLYL